MKEAEQILWVEHLKGTGSICHSAMVKQLLSTKLLNSWIQWDWSAFLNLSTQLTALLKIGLPLKWPRRTTLLTGGWMSSSQSNAYLVKSDFSTTLLSLSFWGEEGYWHCLIFSLLGYQLALQINELNWWAAPIPGPHYTQTRILAASACQCLASQLWELQHQ